MPDPRSAGAPTRHPPIPVERILGLGCQKGEALFHVAREMPIGGHSRHRCAAAKRGQFGPAPACRPPQRNLRAESCPSTKSLAEWQPPHTPSHSHEGRSESPLGPRPGNQGLFHARNLGERVPLRGSSGKHVLGACEGWRLALPAPPGNPPGERAREQSLLCFALFPRNRRTGLQPGAPFRGVAAKT